MALLSIPTPHLGWGFFYRLPSFPSSRLPDNRHADTDGHAHGAPGRRSRHSSLRVRSSCVTPTRAIFTFGWGHGAGGIGMQRAWAVGVSIMCVNLTGIAGGWLSMPEGGLAGSTVIAAEPVRLDPVVVTGTQVAVPVSELPSAITVIDRQEIESRQVTDVPQVLRTVPGLSVRQSGSRGGQTSAFPRGGNPNFNLVLVDGVLVNDAGVEYDFSDLTTATSSASRSFAGPKAPSMVRTPSGR